jgi:hypothetical protein
VGTGRESNATAHEGHSSGSPRRCASSITRFSSVVNDLMAALPSSDRLRATGARADGAHRIIADVIGAT